MAEDIAVIDLRKRREARLRSEIERLKRLERLQVIDRTDADVAIAAVESELDALHHHQQKENHHAQ